MSGILCEHCTGVCCTYIALPIEEPDTRSDFDDIRWYLLHEGISVFVEDDEWYISMATPCRHLLADGRCGAYGTRPKICRKYSAENCDYHSGDYGWELHFTCPEHLDEYVSEYFKKPRNSKSGKPSKNSNDARKRATSLIYQRDSNSGNSKIRKSRLRAQKDIYGVPLPALRTRP